jgi:N-acetylneuraminic acid mutarotase
MVMTRLQTLNFRRMLTLLVTLLLLVSLLAAVPAQAESDWMATGGLTYGLMSHSAALLADGRVLIPGGTTTSGGVVSCSLRRTQVFDPASNTWSTTGDMNTGRSLHTATTLNDGRVLVTGGVDCTFYISAVYASAEIFDPSAGTWSITSNMTISRYRHTATLLNDGRVLVVGGATAEIYDPASSTWSATGSPSASRSGHTATLLDDGRVLVTGGFNAGISQSSSEIFDPATNTWTAAGNMTVSRGEHTATLLNDGRVLVVGGKDGGSVFFASAEIFNPATSIWTTTGSLGAARAFHTATHLDNGMVLVAGGLTNGSILRSTELFDPATGAWTVTGNMIHDRRQHTTTRLNDGRVLAVGGDGSGTCCAELFTSSGGGTQTPVPTPSPSIIVIAANGGEVWKIGSIQTIRWSSEGIAGSIKIEISRDGGATYKQIANNVPNTGAFQWMVSKPATTWALLRIVSLNQPDVQDTSDSVFRIAR